MILVAMRSFDDPPGFRYSTLTSTVAEIPSVTLLSLTRGVFPTRSRTVSAYFMVGPIYQRHPRASVASSHLPREYGRRLHVAHREPSIGSCLQPLPTDPTGPQQCHLATTLPPTTPPCRPPPRSSPSSRSANSAASQG